MITVPEAAKRAGKNPETIRRWIRSGRLKAQRIGTQYIIQEQHLEPLLEDEELPLPPGWSRLSDGRPTPNVVRAIRLSRLGRDEITAELDQVLEGVGTTIDPFVDRAAQRVLDTSEW